MAASRRRVKVPATVLARAQKATQPPVAPAPVLPTRRPREKVVAALKRLTAHPMD